MPEKMQGLTEAERSDHAKLTSQHSILSELKRFTEAQGGIGRGGSGDVMQGMKLSEQLSAHQLNSKASYSRRK